MTLFKDRYRVETGRLNDWDYTSSGYYFVTICTRNRECSLGDVINGVINLSAIGEIVAEEWQKTAKIREYVEMDEWVIMPNHIHGIVIICDQTLQRGASNRNSLIRETFKQELAISETPKTETSHRGVSTGGRGQDCRDVPVARLKYPAAGIDSGNVKTEDIPPRDAPSGRLKQGSLGSILGQFKSVCTKRIWTSGYNFAWQSRFYDEILRDEKSLDTIRHYIRNNPLQWQLDKENPANNLK